jgi:7-carboxy-7-deazaguanine synthase
MIINEIFYSIQGEGKLAGMPSIFIRLAGCPLRCTWCDTPYAWSSRAGSEYTTQQVKTQIAPFPTRHIVITGGEPMTNPAVRELTEELGNSDYHITIETSGIRAIRKLLCDLMSISPKLSNSKPQNLKKPEDYEKAMLSIEEIKILISEYNYQLKFVVEQPRDLDEIARLLDRLDNFDPEKVLLMPQAITRDQYLQRAPGIIEFCKQTGFAFSPRLQAVIWDAKRAK